MPCPTAARPSRSARILANNKAPLDAAETDALIEVILHQPEPAYLRPPDGAPEGRQEPARTSSMPSRSAPPRSLLETHDELNFSLPQHCYEYCNTLGWFWDKFEHPQRLKLLYLAAAFLNQATPGTRS